MALVWNNIDGKENDIVISSRVRLARNIQDKVMPTLMDKEQADEIKNMVFNSITKSNSAISHQFKIIDMDSSPPLEKPVSYTHLDVYKRQYILQGKKQIDVEKLVAGDIGAFSKLQFTTTGDTLCDPDNPILFLSLIHI